jgi:AraC-like DNA-binding protein
MYLKITTETKVKIRKYHLRHSVKKTARRFGVSEATVRNVFMNPLIFNR